MGNDSRKVTVLIYAVSNRSSGGLSVLSDYYKEILEKSSLYQDVRWVILTGADGFKSAKNIKVIRFNDPMHNLAIRYARTAQFVNKIVRKYNVDLALTIQNTKPVGTKIPYVVSLHNVLPLYDCDSTVLDSMKLRVKQRILNRFIVQSLKDSEAVLVPSEWIKDAFVNKKGVNAGKFIVCGLNQEVITPDELKDIEDSSTDRDAAYDGHKGKVGFVYPATAFPYKNHKVILDACKKLKRKGLSDFDVVFTMDVNQGRNSYEVYEESIKQDLPIKFRAFETREDLLREYRNRVLVFPSKIETDALPLIESKGMGGHVIVANLPYAHAAMDGYPSVEYFDPDDAKELSRYMERIIQEGIPAPVEYDGGTDHKKDDNKSRIDMVVEMAQKFHGERLA